MAEFTAVTLQTVAANQNVLFTETPVLGCNCNILHREGSGIVTLRGNTNQCRALYRVSFGANIEVPNGGTVTPISVSIAIDGEPLSSATAIFTPAAAEQFGNVKVSAIIAVPRGCCVSVAVENSSTQAIGVQNASLTVDRIA